MTYTHTYAVLTVSSSTYDEIQKKLKLAEYHHAFHDDGGNGVVIDMHGIALALDPEGGKDFKCCDGNKKRGHRKGCIYRSQK